jgi:hypothetical protein
MNKNLWNKQTFLTLAGMLALLVGLVAFFLVEGLTGNSIYVYAMVAVAVIIVVIAVVYLYLLSRGKIQQKGPDYRSLFFLGLMFFIFGSPENPTFYAIGLVFVTAALVNRKKWEKQPKLSELSPAQRKFRIALIAILGLLALAGFVAWWWFNKN